MSISNLALKYLRPQKKLLYLYIIISLSTSVIGILTPLLSGNIIDLLVEKKQFDSLTMSCLLLFSLTLVNIVLGFFSTVIYTKLHVFTGFEFNQDVLKHLEKLSMSFHNKHPSVYMTQRINNDTNAIIIFFISSLTGILINSLSISFCFLLLFHLSKTICFILVGILFIYLFIYKTFKKNLFKLNFETKEAQNNFFSALTQQLSNIKFIKIHAANHLVLKNTNNKFIEMFSKLLSYQKFSYLFSSVDNIAFIIAQLIVYLLGGFYVINNAMSLGNFTILLSYFTTMITSTRYFLGLGKNYQETLTSFVRIKELLNHPIPHSGKETIDQIENLSLENLSFCYEKENYILKNLNSIFEKGNIYSIIGLNGAGKSTLVELLLGLYPDEYQGEILINGTALSKFDLEKLRNRNIGFTEQIPAFYESTVYNNIHLEQKNINNETFERLLVLFGLERLVPSVNSSFPHKVIDDRASNLSGGEKQKISIVRQLIKKPNLMIFDEPSSCLDEISKNNFLKILNDIKKETIVLIVTHDSFLINASDKIINLGSSSDASFQ